MALWGKFDAKAFETDVSVVNDDATVTTTGDFTDDTTDDYIVAGDILSLDGVQYIVKQVTDATHLELHTVYAGSTGTVSAADAIRRTAPKAAADYMIKNAFGTLVFLDEDEAVLNENRVRGLDGPGWWVYRTFTDADGSTRHKAECIVPLSVAVVNSGDYADNPAADAASAISISAQPANQSTFTPAGGILTFTEGAGTTLAGEASETYTAVAVTGGTGNDDATFTVVRDVNGDIDSVTLVAAGSDYTAADTLTIDGADIGGVSTTDDLTITVDTVATAAATFSVTAADAPDLGDIIYQWQVQTATGTRWTNISGATSASLALTGLTTADSGKKYRVKLTSTAGAEEVISNTATLTVTAA